MNELVGKMKGISARLKEERERFDANQAEFGRIGGVSRNTQSAYEMGKTSPTISYLVEIADHGADVVYILSGRRNGDLPRGHVRIDALDAFGPIDGPAYLVLPQFVLQRKLGPMSLTNIRWAINPSRAMEPEIERNATVLVDVTQSSVSELIDGATYAYSLWGRPDVRRILNRKDHWSVIGFEKGSDHTDVYKDDAESLQIHGAVVAVL